MTWQPPLETDQAVRRWMDAQQLPVTTTHYDFDREVYAWRHEQPGSSYTLRIAQAVIEDNPPRVLTEALELWKVAELLRRKPKAYTWLRRNPSDPKGLIVEQLPGLPS